MSLLFDIKYSAGKNELPTDHNTLNLLEAHILWDDVCIMRSHTLDYVYLYKSS